MRWSLTPILIGDKWNHTHLKSSRETQNFLPMEWEDVEGYSDIATIWHWTEPFYRVGPCGLSKFQFGVECMMIIATNFEFI